MSNHQVTIVVQRRRVLPRLLALMFFLFSYNSLRFGFATGAPAQGAVVAAVFLAVALLFAYPARAFELLGMLIGRLWYGR